MLPHAVSTNNTKNEAYHIEEQKEVDSLLSQSNPFGVVLDPHSLRRESYVSAMTVINQAIYGVSSKIFSYEAVGSKDVLDCHLSLWVQQYGRKNSFGIMPFYHRLQVRSGASHAILGYFGKNGTNDQPVSVVCGADALVYMQPTLANKSARLPLSFNVSALDFDEATQSMVSDYSKCLNFARSLGYLIVSPVELNSGMELQHMTVLNHYLATLTGSPSLYVFEGPEFVKTYTRFDNLESLESVGRLYHKLLTSRAPESTNLSDIVDHAFLNLNKVAHTNYAQFEYVGSDFAETVFVTYGAYASSLMSYVIRKLRCPKLGLIQIRLPLPFNGDKFNQTLPRSTKNVVVVGQAINGSGCLLKADVTLSLFMSGRYHDLSIEDFAHSLDFIWSPITVAKVMHQYSNSFDPATIFSELSPGDLPVTANTSPRGKFILWGSDRGNFIRVADTLVSSLTLDENVSVTLRNKFDNVGGGGSLQSQITSAPKGYSIGTIDAADVVFIEDPLLLSVYDILATAKPGATVLLVNTKQIKNSVEEDVVSKLPVDFRRTLSRNDNALVLVDFSIVKELDAANESTKGFTGDLLVQLAFWRATFPELQGYIMNKLLQANGKNFELLPSVLDKFIAAVDDKQGLKSITVLPEWADLKDEVPEKKEGEEEDQSKPLPFFPQETSFVANPRDTYTGEEEIEHGGYKELVKRLVFPEAYESKKEVRPDVPSKNFVVKVKESKRLTPVEYPRNIFHIDFDISGTGLTYNIGEALGIHGRNNTDEVERFLEFYGVDGNSIIEVTNKEDSSVYELRTARQALTENLDFLGKPAKKFYEDLSHHAQDSKEKEHLEKLSGGAGAEELKKRQDVDFLTYFDVLEEFESARPSFAELSRLIPPIKRREYSIASSQKMHPNSVQLLIVVVDWVDSKGRMRYGQCSKYLSDLQVGSELVVSVKPSVMKLPSESTQPIIMSGLGTGLAPFKAFVEEKVWQVEQGLPIGEVFLFLGSRHKKEEYLYGELWEAYKAAGLLTHIGAAFSRDQPQKIYIQDRIRESIVDLASAFVEKQGHFYLCGPTWPVPDITACLQDIVLHHAERTGDKIKDVAKLVEEMKEEGRYVLEVY